MLSLKKKITLSKAVGGRVVSFFVGQYFKVEKLREAKTNLSLTDFPQTKQVHFLLPPCVHSMCLFLLPVSLNCRPQISQGNGPEKETGDKLVCSMLQMLQPILSSTATKMTHFIF